MTSNTAMGLAWTFCWVAVGLVVVAVVRGAGFLWSWAAVAAVIALGLGSYGWLRQRKEGGGS